MLNHLIITIFSPRSNVALSFLCCYIHRKEQELGGAKKHPGLWVIRGKRWLKDAAMMFPSPVWRNSARVPSARVQACRMQFLVTWLVISPSNLLQNSCRWGQRAAYPHRNRISPEVISARKSWCDEAGGKDVWCVQTGWFLLSRPPVLAPLSLVVRVLNNVYWRGLRCDCVCVLGLRMQLSGLYFTPVCAGCFLCRFGGADPLLCSSEI